MLNISALSLSLPLDTHTRLGKKQNYLSLDDALHAFKIEHSNLGI